MGKTEYEKLTDTVEDKKLYQQEWLILQTTEEICRIMKEKSISKEDLAKRLGRSKGYVTRLLDGTAVMTLRTISDVFFAIDSSLSVSSGPVGFKS